MKDNDADKNISENNYKKAEMLLAFLFVCIPIVLCTVLLIRLNVVTDELDKLKAALGISYADELSGGTGNISQNMVAGTIENTRLSALNQDTAAADSESSDPYEGMIKVCFTFDDGPSPNTDIILDILDEYGLKATFFVNGKEGYDEQYLRIVEEGHTIAMHSCSHVYSDIYYDLDSFAEDLFNIQTKINDITGVMPVYYRFPGGSSNNVCRVSMEDCIDYLEAKGIEYFDWNVSAQDAVPGGATTAQIVSNIMTPINSGLYDTYVILMHDSADKITTVEALPIIIEQIIDMENVVIVPIDEYVTPVHHGEESNQDI